MPTMSSATVHVQPMFSRSTLTLEETRDAMAAKPPSFATLTGGWASTNNHQSNLGSIGSAPPSSIPVIDEATNVLPRMLRARFYYWSTPPAGVKNYPGYNPHAIRRLAALDIVITESGQEHIGILISSRSRQLLNQRDGTVVALERILRDGDDTIRIDRFTSGLHLSDADIFLWLAVQRRDKPQVAVDITLDNVSGIRGRDASSRTADLRAGVDFSRPNFLTSVAEADTLGPIDISFVHHAGTENRSIRAMVHVDGGFEIHRSEIHFPSILDIEDLMVSATLLLAYSLIPRLNDIYISDAGSWADRRIEVIEQAMDDLEQRYKSARAALITRRNRISAQNLELAAVPSEVELIH